MIASFATFMLLKANSFLGNLPVWDDKPVGVKLWLEWKRFFKPLQMALEHETANSSNHPDIFGTAVAAQKYHGILPDLSHFSHSQGGNTQGIMEHLDGHFDNLAAASTNSHAVLDQTAVATTEQYASITAALENLASAAPSKPSTRSTPKTTNPLSPTEKRVTEKRIITLQSAVKNKWKVGGFCSTHGHGVREGHDSRNCSSNKDDHGVKATRANSVGPGKDFNKGWDALLL